jgi:hypothetical protein
MPPNFNSYALQKSSPIFSKSGKIVHETKKPPEWVVSKRLGKTFRRPLPRVLAILIGRLPGTREFTNFRHSRTLPDFSRLSVNACHARD